MSKRDKQKGFTVVELWVCIVILFVLVVLGAAGYVAVHFISKFW